MGVYFFAVIYILKPYIPQNSIGLVFIPILAAVLQEYAIAAGKNVCSDKIPQSAGCDEV